MESIVRKLSEIESAASAIVEHAEAQKEVLDREYRQKRIRFDEDLEAKTSAEIQKILDNLEQKSQSLLDVQDNGQCEAIIALEEEYENRHTQYAENILKRITEV